MSVEKVMMKRAKLAASFSLAVRTTIEGKAFVKKVMESLPEEAELTVVPAVAEEYAALTLHRIERLNIPAVVLVTNDGNEIVARDLLWNSQEPKTGSYNNISTEVTTLDWIKLLENNHGHSFVVTGSELTVRNNTLTNLTLD